MVRNLEAYFLAAYQALNSRNFVTCYQQMRKALNYSPSLLNFTLDITDFFLSIGDIALLKSWVYILLKANLPYKQEQLQKLTSLQILLRGIEVKEAEELPLWLLAGLGIAPKLENISVNELPNFNNDFLLLDYLAQIPKDQLFVWADSLLIEKSHSPFFRCSLLELLLLKEDHSQRHILLSSGKIKRFSLLKLCPLHQTNFFIEGIEQFSEDNLSTAYLSQLSDEWALFCAYLYPDFSEYESRLEDVCLAFKAIFLGENLADFELIGELRQIINDYSRWGGLTESLY